ncbi:MAG: hypothetical protein ACYC21_06530, partial [Eubacteriales bacterium]
MIKKLNDSYGKFSEKAPAGKGSLDQIIDGLKMIQKKFFLKTQGGTDMATDNDKLVDELIAALDGDAGAAQEKFAAFEGSVNSLITTTSNWVIRMT